MNNVNLNEIASNFEKKGFVEIENFITKDQIEYLKNFVLKKYDENNQNYFFLAGKKFNESFEDKHNLFHEIKLSLDEILSKLKLKKKNQELYKVLRVVDGKKSGKESHRYHFDAHLFTVLVPIYIPQNQSGKNGDLVISPNLRSYSNYVLINILQKLIYQSFFFKRLLKKEKYRKKYNFNQVKLKVGNIYLFNGYRSLHGNLEIEKGDLRGTLLIHYHDLFNDSFLVKINRLIRQFRENKVIEKNKSLSHN